MNLNKYQIAQVDTGKTFLVIPNNAVTAVTPFDCEAVPPFAFLTPSNWLAGTVTFSVLPAMGTQGVTNASLAPVYDRTNTGTLYGVVTLAGAGFYPLDPTIFNSIRYININSSVSQSSGDAIVNLILSPVWQGVHN